MSKVNYRKGASQKVSELSVYSKTTQLVRMTEEIVSKMSKDFKFSLGSDLRSMVWELMDGILIANSSKDKTSKLRELISLVHRMQLRFRMVVDLRLMSEGQFANLIEVQVVVKDELHRWFKSESSRHSLEVSE